MTQLNPTSVAASALTTDKTHLPTSSLSRVSPTTRVKAAERGEAMKDGSFPIRDGADLRRAIKAFGRAKDKGAAKRHIIRRAKALGKVDMLPDTWKVLATKEFSGSPKPADKYDAFAAELAKSMTEPITASPPARRLSMSHDLLAKTLAAKADRYNTHAPADRRVTVPKLLAVYYRGLADYEPRDCVTPSQYAQARVNGFLNLLANNEPVSPTYTQDNDLLPRSHPAAS